MALAAFGTPHVTVRGPVDTGPCGGRGARMYDVQAAYGDLVIDGPAWEVRLDGVALDLTRTEFEILLVLASRPRRVVTDEEIVRAVWGDGWFGDDNNLAVHVSKLRGKLGESGMRPRYIRTIRGVGYRFDPDPVPAAGGDASARQRACDGMRRHSGSIEVRTDGQLRVASIEPGGVLVLGHDPRDLQGRYFPVVAGPPWAEHASALQAMEVLIASGVREWTARHLVRRADGRSVMADIATCIEVDADGRLVQLRFVLVECDGELGGGLR